MEEAVRDLKRYEYEACGELVPWLREQIDNLEYDAVAERLKSFLAGQPNNPK
jgi:hypothetical protein